MIIKKKKNPKKSIPGAGLNGRPLPPETLETEEAMLWVSIVNTRPPDYFKADTQSLLESYVRYVVQERSLSKFVLEQIRSKEDADKESYPNDSEYLRRLISMQTQTTSKIVSLSRSMRLTQQSRYVPHDTVGRGNPKDLKEKPWEYDGKRPLRSVK